MRRCRWGRCPVFEMFAIEAPLFQSHLPHSAGELNKRHSDGLIGRSQERARRSFAAGPAISRMTANVNATVTK
jgi:hypothetical protein